jgi:hypothetical protein
MFFAQKYFFHTNEFLNEILNVKDTYSCPNAQHCFSIYHFGINMSF